MVVRLREKAEPRPAEFDEVRARAVEDAKAAKRKAILDRRVETLRQSLAAGASLDSLAAPWGGLKDSGLLPRTTQFVPGLGSEPRVVERAFALEPGQASDTVHVAQGVTWLRLEERKSADVATLAGARAALEAELAKAPYDAWIEARKRTMRIEILRADLRGPRPVTPGR